MLREKAAVAIQNGLKRPIQHQQIQGSSLEGNVQPLLGGGSFRAIKTLQGAIKVSE